MSKRSSASGWRKRMRRTFLFPLGLGAAKLLADYFSIPQNRTNFIKLLSQLWQTLIAQVNSSQAAIMKAIGCV